MFSRRMKDQEKRATPKYTCVCFIFIDIYRLGSIFLFLFASSTMTLTSVLIRQMVQFSSVRSLGLADRATVSSAAREDMSDCVKVYVRYLPPFTTTGILFSNLLES